MDIFSAYNGSGHLIDNPYLLFARSGWVSELLTSAIYATEADFGNVQLFDSSRGSLRIAAQHGFRRDFLRYFEDVRKDDACVCGAALSRQSRVIVPNVASDAMFRDTSARHVLLRAGVRAVQSTPVVHASGNLLGIVSTHYNRPTTPSERVLKCLDGIVAEFLSKIESGLTRPPSSAVMRRRVLSTSRDAAVLRTRNLIIESAGYEVVTTREPDMFLHLLGNQDFDAAVIGDSIRIDTRCDLARTAKALRPDVPLIVFCRNAAEAQSLLMADYLVEALGQPERFVEVLRVAIGDGRMRTPGKS